MNEAFAGRFLEKRTRRSALRLDRPQQRQTHPHRGIVSEEVRRVRARSAPPADVSCARADGRIQEPSDESIVQCIRPRALMLRTRARRPHPPIRGETRARRGRSKPHVGREETMQQRDLRSSARAGEPAGLLGIVAMVLAGSTYGVTAYPWQRTTRSACLAPAPTVGGCRMVLNGAFRRVAIGLRRLLWRSAQPPARANSTVCNLGSAASHAAVSLSACRSPASSGRRAASIPPDIACVQVGASRGN